MNDVRVLFSNCDICMVDTTTFHWAPTSICMETWGPTIYCYNLDARETFLTHMYIHADTQECY